MHVTRACTANLLDGRAFFGVVCHYNSRARESHAIDIDPLVIILGKLILCGSKDAMEAPFLLEKIRADDGRMRHIPVETTYSTAVATIVPCRAVAKE